MTALEMRKAKQELHKIIIDTVLSYRGTIEEDNELYKYIIGLCLNELV
jgi:hypothetical protein